MARARQACKAYLAFFESICDECSLLSIPLPLRESPCYNNPMYVPIAQIEPGAVACSPILDVRDQLLAPPGAILTQELLAQLSSRGVSLIDIVVAEDPATHDSAVAKEKARLVDVFSRSELTPELAQLQRALMEEVDA